MYVINPKTISFKASEGIRKALNKVKINCLFAYAVLDNKAEGIIAIDSYSNPELFYVRHGYGMSLLFGRTDKYKDLIEFGQWLKVTKTETEFLQIYPQIKESFSLGIKFDLFDRINFKFNKEKYLSNKIKIHSSFHKQKVTKDMFNMINGKVVPKNFWKNADDFEKHSIGVSVLDDNKPISTAFAAFVNKNMLELGIETDTAYRGKNMAYTCCNELIDYCLKNSLMPVWACRKDNVGSYKLALKLGFEPMLSIPYYKL